MTFSVDKAGETELSSQLCFIVVAHFACLINEFFDRAREREMAAKLMIERVPVYSSHEYLATLPPGRP